MNSIVVLTLAFFLTGNVTGSKSVQAPSMEDCQAAIPLLTEKFLGTSVPTASGEKLLVLDVQGSCQEFKQQEHA